jgi:hypothetical protein
MMQILFCSQSGPTGSRPAGLLGPQKKKDADLFRTLKMKPGASNFAEALGGNRSGSQPEEKIAKMRDKKRKELVLADLANGQGETQRQVGQKHGISARWVRQIKHNAKKSQIEHVDWYRLRLGDVLSSIDPYNMDLDPPTTYTTNLKAEAARIITADELNKHLIRGATDKIKKEFVRARIVNETSKDVLRWPLMTVEWRVSLWRKSSAIGWTKFSARWCPSCLRG